MDGCGEEIKKGRQKRSSGASANAGQRTVNLNNIDTLGRQVHLGKTLKEIIYITNFFKSDKMTIYLGMYIKLGALATMSSGSKSCYWHLG